MDINKHTNRQHKTTDISPYLRKAQVISPEVWAYYNKEKINKHKRCKKATRNLWNIII